MPRPPLLTDDQVRAIKKSLLLGTHPIVLAQVYRVGAETIRRIKRGETHTRVRVAGEEALRPEIELLGEGVEAVPGEEKRVLHMPPVREGSVEESLRKLQGMGVQGVEVGAPPAPAPAPAKPETDDSAVELARRFGAPGV